MDNFLSEICSICKLPFNEVISDYKIIQISNRVIFIYNYIKLIDYSNSKIILKVKNDTLEISGENLFISQIDKNEILIKGNILMCNLGSCHVSK